MNRGKGFSGKFFKIYVLLVLAATTATGLNTLMGASSYFMTGFLDLSVYARTLMDMVIMFFLYGLLGLFGFKLAGEIGLPGVWSVQYPGLIDYLEPAFAGIAVGLIFIFLESGFAGLHGLGYFAGPGFPHSLFALITGAVAEEILYRLFLIPVLVAVILAYRQQRFSGEAIPKGKKGLSGSIYWPAAAAAGIIYTLAHGFDMIVSLEEISLTQLPPLVWLQVLLMNLVLALAAAWQFRRRGYLAAVMFHAWFGLVWYIIRGGFLI